MANPHINTYKEINYIIRRTFPDIPSQVDPEGFILADGVSLTKNVYDPANGKYELHVRDRDNEKWKSFDSEDNPDFIEDAAGCFVEFYKAKQQGKAKHQAKPTDCMADFRKSYEDIRTGHEMPIGALSRPTMKKEALVFVRHGSPWIDTACPNCREHITFDQKFCAECGQELSYENYKKICQTGGTGIKMTGAWTQCIPDDGVNREVFIRELEKLERTCQVHPKDEAMLKIMREAYVDNCFGKEKETT